MASVRVGIDASNIADGGGFQHLCELLSAVDPDRHKIETITVWGGKHTLDSLPARPWLRLVYIPAVDRSRAHRAWWQRTGLDRLARQTCDVLLVPGGTYLGSFRPFVTMSRNLLPFEVIERRRYGWSLRHLRYVALEFVQSATMRRATGVIFLTRTAQGVVERRSGRLQGGTRVIPHGVADALRRTPRPQMPLSAFSAHRPFRWIYVSIVNWYKHQWHVVDAVARLRARGFPVELQMVGPAYGPALQRLRASMKAADPNGEFIRYEGPVAHARMASLYESSDGAIVASSCETFGQVLVEAMASGLPIACSDRSALPEVLGGTGELFDPEDSTDIARALELLLTDRDRRQRMAELAVNRAAHFSWPSTADKTFSFLSEIAARHPVLKTAVFHA